MPDVLTLFLIFLAFGLFWGLLKALLKLTLKVFSCGLLVILAVTALIYAITHSGAY